MPSAILMILQRPTPDWLRRWLHLGFARVPQSVPGRYNESSVRWRIKVMLFYDIRYVFRKRLSAQSTYNLHECQHEFRRGYHPVRGWCHRTPATCEVDVFPRSCRFQFRRRRESSRGYLASGKSGGGGYVIWSAVTSISKAGIRSENSMVVGGM